MVLSWILYLLQAFLWRWALKNFLNFSLYPNELKFGMKKYFDLRNSFLGPENTMEGIKVFLAAFEIWGSISLMPTEWAGIWYENSFWAQEFSFRLKKNLGGHEGLIGNPEIWDSNPWCDVVSFNWKRVLFKKSVYTKYLSENWLLFSQSQKSK